MRMGFITLKKINGRTMQYAITPDGMHEIANRSYRYMRRTIGNIVRWKEDIDHTIRTAKHNGARSIVLAGPSDLAFIVEHSCQRHNLEFHHEPDPAAVTPAPTRQIVLNENIDLWTTRAESTPDTASADKPGSGLQPLYLRDVL